MTFFVTLMTIMVTTSHLQASPACSSLFGFHQKTKFYLTHDLVEELLSPLNGEKHIEALERVTSDYLKKLTHSDPNQSSRIKEIQLNLFNEGKTHLINKTINKKWFFSFSFRLLLLNSLHSGQKNYDLFHIKNYRLEDFASLASAYKAFFKNKGVLTSEWLEAKNLLEQIQNNQLDMDFLPLTHSFVHSNKNKTLGSNIWLIEAQFEAKIRDHRIQEPIIHLLYDMHDYSVFIKKNKDLSRQELKTIKEIYFKALLNPSSYPLYTREKVHQFFYEFWYKTGGMNDYANFIKRTGAFYSKEKSKYINTIIDNYYQTYTALHGKRAANEDVLYIRKQIYNLLSSIAKFYKPGAKGYINYYKNLLRSPE